MTDQGAQGRGSGASGTSPRPRPSWAQVVLAICAFLLFSVFMALGTWQVERLQWKRDLIARVNARIHAPPVPAPGPDQWSAVQPASHEYLRVQVAGTLLHTLATPVQASTRLGSGYWILTPLEITAGHQILVNRGFVPPGQVPQVLGTPGREQAVITGLLRISEPGGGFLRENDPAGNRWYSRDVAAIAKARGLEKAAPYFIDAEAPPGTAAGATEAQTYPVAGLTVVNFPNSHLVYALTWYTLALMVLLAVWWVRRESRHRNTTGAD